MRREGRRERMEWRRKRRTGMEEENERSRHMK